MFQLWKQARTVVTVTRWAVSIAEILKTFYYTFNCFYRAWIVAGPRAVTQQGISSDVSSKDLHWGSCDPSHVPTLPANLNVGFVQTTGERDVEVEKTSVCGTRIAKSQRRKSRGRSKQTT